jgi:hypothetical protein
MISPGCPSAAAGRDHDGDGKGIALYGVKAVTTDAAMS